MTTDTVLVRMVREVGADPRRQGEIEALSDDELLQLGLAAVEIEAIRDGFFDRALRLGIMPDPDSVVFGCCAG
jgi:hypothetical protein